MSCCGQKRSQLKQEMKHSFPQSGHEVVHSRPEPEKKPRVFEYTGDRSLTVRGISTGKVYHFRFNGDKIEVNYFDSFPLMAERELKISL